MSVILLDLPPSIFSGICQFLNDNSILLLRLVSKAANARVSTLVCTENTTIASFSIKEFELDIGPLAPQDVKLFLAHAKPLFLLTEIRYLKSIGNQPWIIRECSKFLEGKIVREIRMSSAKYDSEAVLDLMQTVGATSIKTVLNELNEDSIKYMCQLATQAKSISCYMPIATRANDIFLPFVKGLFSGKCDRFELFAPRYYMYFNEAEELITFFHHLDKQVFLFVTCTFEESEVDIHIGQYKLKKRRRTLVIKHLYV